MLQGRGSGVGTSVLVAGPCRARVDRGLAEVALGPQEHLELEAMLA
jgi:cobyric acid synthase